ncbi:hypothetical protein PanWU01x14_047270, partial [Parasponia andersonii]
VSLSFEAINTYYNFPNIKEDKYAHYITEELDYDSIITQMCSLDIRRVSQSDDDTLALAFQSNALN